MPASSPPPSRTSVGPVRSSESHEAILAAAKQVLRERGYGGFSIDAVARLSKASKPTIYRRWPQKAALIIELYDRETAHVLNVPDLGSVAAELIALARSNWALWRETAAGDAVRGIIAEAQTDPEALRRLRDTFMPDRRRFARQVFGRGQQRGEIPASASIETAVDMFNGFNWYHLLTDQIRKTDEPAIESAVEILLAGLTGSGG